MNKIEETLQNYTILVIEDNIDMLQLIGRILLREGLRVLLAQDSIYGLSILKESNPDMVLLDIKMPEPDGFETLRLIREHSDIPVIMVTANWEQEAVDRALALGADDYVKKPFRSGELVARIKAKLRRFNGY
ncbi:response regulator transcription factor [Chloroflexota bacterium]